MKTMKNLSKQWLKVNSVHLLSRDIRASYCYLVNYYLNNKNQKYNYSYRTIQGGMLFSWNPVAKLRLLKIFLKREFSNLRSYEKI